MKLKVKLFASLRKFNPEHEDVELKGGTTVLEFIKKIGIPPTEVAIVLVDGRHAKLEQTLHDGETISL